MELPFTIVFEPPSRTELRAGLRMRGTWAALGVLVALAIGTLAVAWSCARTEATASGVTVPLDVTSRPSGAAVWLDGRERGSTPLTVQVESGAHSVQLKARDAVDGRYTVSAGPERGVLDAVLWRRQPSLARIRPSLPGATLADVRLLADGALALSIALPPGPQLQAWRLDPQTGQVTPVLTDVTGTRLVVAPDGQHVAILGFEVGPPGPGSETSGFASARASLVWLASGPDRASFTGWRPALVAGEQLLDASWSPSADRLLVVTGQNLPGGAVRSRLWLVDAFGLNGRELLSLPSEVAPGSEVWSPDGQHVALLAHAGQVNALCQVDLDGGFRYVADLDSGTAPLAYLPATWATDSRRLVFVAPHQRPPGAPLGWLQADAPHALYVADAADPTPRLLADTEVDFAAWREDGQLVGLGRLGPGHALAIRLLAGSSSPSAEHLLELPLRPASAYAALWDLARARVLLAVPSAAGGLEYWLALFGLEGQP